LAEEEEGLARRSPQQEDGRQDGQDADPDKDSGDQKKELLNRQVPWQDGLPL
jgi:hypothetical protein